MLKRYRWTIVIAVIFAGWLLFGQDIITRVLEGENPPIYDAVDGLPDNLDGRLIYTQGIDGIHQIDLTSGEHTVLWDTPQHDYVQGIAISPDGTQAAITYAPTLEELAIESSTNLYITALDDIDLQLLVERDVITTHYSHPIWTGDGIYYAFFRIIEAGSPSYERSIDRISSDGGTPQTVLENALEMHIAPQGTLYVYFDNETFVTSLWLRDDDGTRQLHDGTGFEDIASPRFYDGEIIFSGSGGPVDENVAQAHGAAWDVWRIDAEGNLQRMTHLELDGPFITLSPDGTRFAFVALEGVYVYIGDTLYRIADSTAEGEIVWLPD